MTRRLLWIPVLLGASVAAAFAYGCMVPDACESSGTCPGQAAAADAAGPDADAAGPNADAAVRDACAGDSRCASAIDAPACDPTKDPREQPCVLDDAYGVFVASVAAGAGGAGGEGGAPESIADGSRAHPYPTVTQALANLGPKTRVYVCNGVYSEQVRVTAPVSIYGGLSCAVDAGGIAWSYVGGSAQVMSPSAAYALAVTGVLAGAVTIEDMTFVAPSALVSGGSSIAASIASSSVNLRRVTLVAGNGADGAAGADGTSAANFTGLASNGAAQVVQGTSSVVAISGGPGGINRCAQYGSSAGGDGGLGCAAGLDSPGLGTAGTADPPAEVTTPGRDGVSYHSALPDGGINTLGNDPGADGVAGDGGAAAPAQDYGTLSPTGWLASAGGDGAPGSPGQGGAGGTDPLYNACGAPTQSIGGGGGGAGGCGGAGGKGGRGGGASIALVADGAILDLQQCVLTAAAAGAGGAGGAGQDGQAGGAGGDDSTFVEAHVAGAAGGNGAGGSGGAGGTGGISVAVLYRGKQIAYDTATSQAITFGLAGDGGSGGPPGKHPVGGPLVTGSDGYPGAPGNAGTSAAFLEVL